MTEVSPSLTVITLNEMGYTFQSKYGAWQIIQKHRIQLHAVYKTCFTPKNTSRFKMKI